MRLRASIRRALGLHPYSLDVAERETGRHEFSLELAREHTFGRSVLDVGCDGGWFESGAARKELGASITGIEPFDEALAIARANAPESTFVAGSALALPFADESYDAAVMFEVIEHLPRGTESRALAELRRVLKSGGALLLSTPNAHPVANVLDPAWYVGHRHYSQRRIRALLEGAGFEVERVLVRGGVGEISGMWLLYAYKHLLAAEAPFKGWTEPLRTREFLGGRGGFTNIFVVARAR